MTRWVDLSQEIPGLRGGSVHVLAARAEAEVRERLGRHGFEMRTLEGSRAVGESGFFVEAARALGLPSWFGANWDAFNDCLPDVLQGGTGRTAVLWREAHLSLEADLQTVLNAVLAFEATASYLDGGDEEPPQLVVFLFGEGSGFGGGERS